MAGLKYAHARITPESTEFVVIKPYDKEVKTIGVGLINISSKPEMLSSRKRERAQDFQKNRPT